MTHKTTVIKRPESRELIIERLLSAAPEIVWQTWTQPEHLVHWFGPRFWTAHIHEMDLRPGGIWRYSLEANDGSGIARCKAIYQKIDTPSRLLYSDSFADADWQVIPGSEAITTVLLEQIPSGTKLTIATQYSTLEDLNKAESMGMIEGFTEAFDRLHEYITTL